MARELSTYDVWLLIRDDDLFPFSAHGFDIAQGSLGSAMNRWSGCLFLNPDGEVFELVGIAPRDKGLTASAKRLLGLAYGIRTELRPAKLDLPALKNRVVAGLETYHAQAEDDDSWAFATRPLAVSTAVIMDATDARQLYSILELPPPLECLDLL
ncbi:MAG: hypothetical protein HKN02_08050 [Rhodobacteraceae bacterium]|nr:hypothetical protein [Paracoccaceae bacterium]